MGTNASISLPSFVQGLGPGRRKSRLHRKRDFLKEIKKVTRFRV